MQRILIIGSCGAGKSTLAIALGKKLSFPVIHLDSHYWQPGWQETEEARWQKIQPELIQAESWIMDGNYGKTMEIRLAAADAIIWLDYNRYLCLWRVFRRYLQYPGKVRPDMGVECPERLSWEFTKYVWDFPKLHRPQIATKLQQYQTQKQVIVVKNHNQMLDLLS